MFFNPETGKFTKFGNLTPGLRAYLDRQVASGVMVSTEHPSEEEIREADAFWTPEEGRKRIADAKAAAKKAGCKDSALWEIMDS